MKIKTAELQGKALDWAVGVCEGMPPNYFDADNQTFNDDEGMLFCPSANWSQGGPIIGREGIEFEFDGNLWNAGIFRADCEKDFVAQGQTHLIAAMRCYVASKLGDEVEVPKELGE